MQISFLGAGKIATAIAGGLIAKDVFAPHRIMASDISAEAREAFAAATGAQAVESNSFAVAESDVVVVAVKPQHAANALMPLKHSFHDKLLISIAAGLRLQQLQDWTAAKRIVRVMPNTPVLVGLGASVYTCAEAVTAADKKIAVDILQSIGLAMEMSEEKLDAVTAVSGSGPAFLFAYIEAMVAAAEEQGLDPDAAFELMVQTVAGAVEMLRRQLGTPAELRQAVTSKGGTTAAGLAVLAERGFDAAIKDCIEAATQRSIELGNQ